MGRNISKNGLYYIQHAPFLSTNSSSRSSVTLHGKITPKTPCKPFRLCAVSCLWVRFFRMTPPYYPACIAVMNSTNNAKVVPSGSAELGERIHIHTIARNAGEPSEMPQFPRLYLPKKSVLGLDRAMTSSMIVASSVQPLNTVMQQSTDWPGTLALLSWLLSDRFWRGMARFDGKMKANSETTLH